MLKEKRIGELYGFALAGFAFILLLFMALGAFAGYILGSIGAGMTVGGAAAVIISAAFLVHLGRG